MMELYLTDEVGREFIVSVDSEEVGIETTTFASALAGEIENHLTHTIKIIARVGEMRYLTTKNDDPAKVLEMIFAKAREEIDAWNKLSQAEQPRHP